MNLSKPDLEHWEAPLDADVLFSNATFQWVPKHLEVLQRLLHGMKKGVVLAVQMPENLDEPSHVAIDTRSSMFCMRINCVALLWRVILLPLPHDDYAALKPLCSRFDIWHGIYNHPLDGIAGIVEWVKGTGLRRFLDSLNADEQQDYPARYQIC